MVLSLRSPKKKLAWIQCTKSGASCVAVLETAVHCSRDPKNKLTSDSSWITREKSKCQHCLSKTSILPGWLGLKMLDFHEIYWNILSRLADLPVWLGSKLHLSPWPRHHVPAGLQGLPEHSESSWRSRCRSRPVSTISCVRNLAIYYKQSRTDTVYVSFLMDQLYIILFPSYISRFCSCAPVWPQLDMFSPQPSI